MAKSLKRLELEVELKNGMLELRPLYHQGKVPVFMEIYPSKISLTGHPIGKKRKVVIWVEQDEEQEEKEVK